MPERDGHPLRQQPSLRALRPLDEADRVLEVRLEPGPVVGAELLDAVEGEMRDAVVAMADGVRRARDRALAPQRRAGAADERRLARAELARDRDDVARRELAGEARRDLLGRLGRAGGELGATQKRPS